MKHNFTSGLGIVGGQGLPWDFDLKKCTLEWSTFFQDQQLDFFHIQVVHRGTVFFAAGFGNQGRAKIMITPETGVKFENVAGIDEARFFLNSGVDFG